MSAARRHGPVLVLALALGVVFLFLVVVAFLYATSVRTSTSSAMQSPALAISSVVKRSPDVARSSAAVNTARPAKPVRLIFIHHSTGEAWLSDSHGKLGLALRANNYFVSDTNYGWGPDSIGDSTDIGNWWQWFRGPRSSVYMSALYKESGQNCSYSRLAHKPGGANQIVVFKSCFPNSALKGNPNAAVPAISHNPLRGQGADSSYHTVANAKGIYIDLLHYFAAHQEKLFIVVTAPPLSDKTYAHNARLFNNWLTTGWLKNYHHKNVFVFDFYDVLTSNGGSANTSDAGRATGNHHRVWKGAIQHKTNGGGNVLAYPTGDDHPSAAGDRKATSEFLPLLNYAYNRWQASRH